MIFIQINLCCDVDKSSIIMVISQLLTGSAICNLHLALHLAYILKEHHREALLGSLSVGNIAGSHGAVTGSHSEPSAVQRRLCAASCQIVAAHRMMDNHQLAAVSLANRIIFCFVLSHQDL